MIPLSSRKHMPYIIGKGRLWRRPKKALSTLITALAKPKLEITASENLHVRPAAFDSSNPNSENSRTEGETEVDKGLEPEAGQPSPDRGNEDSSIPWSSDARGWVNNMFPEANKDIESLWRRVMLSSQRYFTIHRLIAIRVDPCRVVYTHAKVKAIELLVVDSPACR
uniref:Uncharacterized protein LOC104218858 n=1 Tax=Nicotiana sylvestris TaxID=4096 RepID=A0A1U7VS16_NICSY|nr:PREDICTED: uncharacterized protein LOC104218858 [Nicotiana sylvestris]